MKKVQIVQPKETWPAEFQSIAAKLRAGLGDLALRVDHIGSTAVPDLAAKDVIDVQITVASLGESLIAAMERIGYIRQETIRCDHRPPGFAAQEEAASEWEKWLFHAPDGQRPTNTHVRVAGRANQRYALLFRDYLRAHPKTAQAYAELKRRLAQHLADPNTYPDVKDPAVDLIYLAAEDWAAATDWEQASPDG